MRHPRVEQADVFLASAISALSDEASAYINAGQLAAGGSVLGVLGIVEVIRTELLPEIDAGLGDDDEVRRYAAVYRTQ